MPVWGKPAHLVSRYSSHPVPRGDAVGPSRSRKSSSSARWQALVERLRRTPVLQSPRRCPPTAPERRQVRSLARMLVSHASRIATAASSSPSHACDRLAHAYRGWWHPAAPPPRARHGRLPPRQCQRMDTLSPGRLMPSVPCSCLHTHGAGPLAPVRWCYERPRQQIAR